MRTGTSRDRGAVVGERRPHLLKSGAGQGGRPAAVAAFGFGGGDPFGGQLVLQVALELPDRGDHVDEQRCRGVVGGEVMEVRQRSRQDAQGDAAGLASVADGVDVDQVAAQPEQLRDRQDVPGVRGGGDLGVPLRTLR